MNNYSKKLTHALTAFGLVGILPCLGAAVVILDEDFSTLPRDVDLEDRATWWGPSWNSGDLAYSRVALDGPGGLPAITKTTEVFAGRFYGGGLRNGVIDMPDFGGVEVRPGDVNITFWVRGDSTQDRGQIGFSMVSFDSSSGSNVETGAAYYLVPIVPAEWTEINLNLVNLRAGIPGHGTDGKAFDLSSDKFQVFFWTRNDFEQGWPIQENEDHVWSFSIAGLSIFADVEGGGSTWGGYPVVGGWADTGDFLGMVYVDYAPWVYSTKMESYIYVPEDGMAEDGSWIFILR